MSDKDIIQKIIESSAFQKYLAPTQAEADRQESGLESLLRSFLEFLSENLANLDWTKVAGIMESIFQSFGASFLLYILIILLVARLFFKAYGYISKTRFKISKTPQPDETDANWKKLSQMPDRWQELTKNVLDRYLSPICMELQPHTTLRQCLKALEKNKKDDDFIRGLVTFLEKWHFSNWQPDQRVVHNWFIRLKERSEQFQQAE